MTVTISQMDGGTAARDLAARSDGLTVLPCPRRNGEPIAAQRCVREQKECPLAASCSFAKPARRAHIEIEAEKRADRIVMGSTGRAPTEADLKACEICERKFGPTLGTGNRGYSWKKFAGTRTCGRVCRALLRQREKGLQKGDAKPEPLIEPRKRYHLTPAGRAAIVAARLRRAARERAER